MNKQMTHHTYTCIDRIIHYFLSCCVVHLIYKINQPHTIRIRNIRILQYNNIQPEQNMAMVESTLSSALKKHQLNPYNQESKPQYTFYIQLTQPDNVLKIQLDLEPITLVSDALLLAIDVFNLQLNSQGKTLVKNIDFYIPRLPKKNGKPKIDMPCLDINQKLADIKLTSISIQVKQPEKAILTKKLESQEEPSKRSDTKSTIMVEMSERSVKSSKKYSEQLQEHELAKAEKQNSCFCSFC